MNKDKMIEFAKDQCEIFPEDSYMGKYLRKTLKMLQEEPCEDAVSRKAVLYGLASIAKAKAKSGAQKSLIGRVMFFVEQLPPVTPTCKKKEQISLNTGHWFVDERPESDREIICSSCEQPIFRYHKLDFDYRPNYCPNCGAKMREEK